MADKKVLEEVKYRKALGRNDILGIKRELFLQGYKPQEIDAAVAEVYPKEIKQSKKPQKPAAPPINRPPLPDPYAHNSSVKLPGDKHKIKISGKALVITLIIIALAISGFLFIRYLNNTSDAYSEEEAIIEEDEVEGDFSSITMNVKEFAPEISEGTELPFSILVENPEYQSGLEVKIKMQVSNLKGKNYLEQEETLTLTSETSEVTYSESLPTSSLKEGNYKVKISALSGEEEKKIIKYFAVSKNRTLNVNIEIVEQEQSCTLDSQCSDDNPCTEDVCTANRCTFTPKLKCCGNFICEADEDQSSCNVDCKAAGENSKQSDQNIIQQALDRAKANPSLSSQLCSSIQNAKNKDVCYSQIALNTSRTQFCSQITDADAKDNCYLSLTTKSSPACDYILDPIKKETCLAILEN